MRMGVERTANALTRLAEELSIDHHSQGVAIPGLISVVILFRSPLMLAAMVAYLFMHFSYGGSGTFQKPLRIGSKKGLIDILIVLTGIAGLLTYIGLALFFSVIWFRGILSG